VSIYQARADAALAAGDQASAATWLRQSVGVAATPEKRYELGTLAGSLGDSETFRAQLSAILIEAPGTPWAESALGDLQAAGYSVDAGQAGYVHYRRRNYEDARAILAIAVDEPGITAEDRAFRTYYLAAAYEDDGYAAAAIPLYDSIAAIAPASPYVHRAKYWAARATEVAGSAIDASERYVDLVDDPVGGEFTRESAFRAGFVLLDAGDAAGAVKQWDSLQADLDGRMLYWRGRAEEFVDPAAAHATFEQAATQDPVSFYGQAAAVRIGQATVPGGGFTGPVEFRPIDWDAIATWVEPGSTALFPADSAARQLAELGLIREAEALLQQEVAARNLTRLQFLGYIRAAHEAGLTSLTARWATQFAAGASGVPDDLARLSFPIDYVDLLNQAGEEHDVDPLFLAALIRQESYWDAGAVSVASARGLTQVIPSTGSSIAAALGYGDWAVGDLFLPAISLEFGAYYIGAQLNRFESPLAALSAYNGGPGNAAQWLANAASSDPADYVEAVTFSETRGYVVIVMENYARYRALYR
jgi:soluble lytic murein transglycosylase